MRVKNIQKTEDKKEEIMRQAFLLMEKKGIKDISMREVAQACGVTKPVLYYYFKDKEDLCFKIINSKMEASNIALQQEVQSGASFKEILIFIFSKYVFSLGSHKDQADFFLHLHSFAGSNPKFFAKVDVARKKSFDMFKQILEEEYKQGHITARARDIGLHLILANIAHLVMHRDCTDVKFGPDYAKDMALMIFSALQYKGENNK